MTPSIHPKEKHMDRRFRSIASTLALLAGLACATAATATPAIPAPIPVREFMRDAAVEQARLSPDGSRLVVTVPMPDRTVAVVLSLPALETLGSINLGADRYVVDVEWADGRWLLHRGARRFGSRDVLTASPETFATDVEANRSYQLPGDNARYEGRASGDPDSVLIGTWGGAQNTLYRHRVGSAGGTQNTVRQVGNPRRIGARVAVGPTQLFGRFVVDADDAPRWFLGDEEAFEHVMLRWVDGDWVEHYRGPINRAPFTPIAIAADGRTYARRTVDDGVEEIGLHDAATDTFEVLASDPVVDPGALLWSTDRRTLLAVEFDAGRPRWAFVAPDHPETAAYRTLVASFPDHALAFGGRTDDGTQLLFTAHSDREPGQVFLFDVASGQARFLFGRRDWLDPEQLAPMRGIRFAARDGRALHGYLTTPVGREARDLPLVLLPHGGPYDLRDAWGFQPEVQLLANRGYAVLQVNYRGSGGYGARFVLEGYRGWGTTLQDDLADGVRWAIAEGIADPGRVCVYGASFGGYSALMGPIRHPELYRCAAGYVGPYDLPMMQEAARMRGNRFEIDYFERTLPATEDEQRAQSPMRRAAELRVPVLLAHGGRDERVQTRQYRGMLEALEAAGRPAEVAIYKPGEGHGFTNIDNQVEFYEALLAFLDRHIGEGRAATPPPAPAP